MMAIVQNQLYASTTHAIMSETKADKDTNTATADDRSILRAFYREQGLSEEQLDESQRYRFVRLNPRFDKEETLKLLKLEYLKRCKDSGDSVSPLDYPILVPWLQEEWGFYALPGDFRLVQSLCFQSGRVYGQDVSSGAAVAALLTDDYDDATVKCKSDPNMATGLPSSEPLLLRVLDLCCAPGLKLCAIADWLQTNDIPSQVVGTDISDSRLKVCSRVIRKYMIDPDTSRQPSVAAPVSSEHDKKSCVRMQVYCNDGTSFLQKGTETNLVFDSFVATEDLLHCGKRKRINKSAKARHSKQLKEIQQRNIHLDSNGELHLFDRVLVDAECSTDGSIKHIQKRLRINQNQSTGQGNNSSRIASLTDSGQLDTLVTLQKGLVANGFRLLKPGGTMVYSTCSLSEEQNENVVAWLLETFHNAELVPIAFLAASNFIKQGALPGTLRVLPGSLTRKQSEDRDSPSSSRETTPRHGSLVGGGFFLAKITKKTNERDTDTTTGTTK
jgi:16S rRNA C967 or C1407 C5-methylase (RsmB/RsmF family)